MGHTGHETQIRIEWFVWFGSLNQINTLLNLLFIPQMFQNIERSNDNQ